MTDDNIQSAVRTELASDPRLPHADEIAVEAYGGAVTLRGTVGSFAQRRAAVMHGSWDHILGNMLFLAILGKNVGASGAVAREPAAAAS